MLRTNSELRLGKNVTRRHNNQPKSFHDSVTPFQHKNTPKYKSKINLQVRQFGSWRQHRILTVIVHYNLIMQYSPLYRQKIILYAEHCPEQPYITDKQQPARVVTRKIVQRSQEFGLTYRPRIIKGHNFSANLHDQFEYEQHGRELASLYKRIKNCKSLSQRKKDHNDPIIYPSYFVRQQKRAKDARIDGYFKQVALKKTKKAEKSRLKNKNLIVQLQSQRRFSRQIKIPAIRNGFTLHSQVCRVRRSYKNFHSWRPTSLQNK